MHVNGDSHKHDPTNTIACTWTSMTAPMTSSLLYMYSHSRRSLVITYIYSGCIYLDLHDGADNVVRQPLAEVLGDG